MSTIIRDISADGILKMIAGTLATTGNNDIYNSSSRATCRFRPRACKDRRLAVIPKPTLAEFFLSDNGVRGSSSENFQLENIDRRFPHQLQTTVWSSRRGRTRSCLQANTRGSRDRGHRWWQNTRLSFPPFGVEQGDHARAEAARRSSQQINRGTQAELNRRLRLLGSGRRVPPVTQLWSQANSYWNS